MGIFGSHLWPYSNLHGINLDYILEKIGTVDQAISEAQSLLTQATETAAMIAEQMTEIRQLVEDATGDVADANELLAQANTLLESIQEELAALKYQRAENRVRSDVSDPQVINIPLKIGHLRSDTDISPVEDPQANTLVTWGSSLVDTEPEAEHVSPVGYYSTDKALIFPINLDNYLTVAQWRFYYTIDNTSYTEVAPQIRKIDYYNDLFYTVIFPDTALWWSAVGPNNTTITNSDNLPALVGRWVHKSIFYNAGVTFVNITDLVSFAARAERHSYYPQTWQLQNSDTDGGHTLKLENFYGAGRIQITRANTGITFAGNIEINNCANLIIITMNNAALPFLVHDDSGDYTNIISVLNSQLQLYAVGILDTAESKANVLAINNAQIIILNVDVKGVNAVFKPSAGSLNRIHINMGLPFTGNAAYFLHPNSSYAEMVTFAGGSAPKLPQVTYGQDNVIDEAQLNSIFMLSDSATVTFTASRQT